MKKNCFLLTETQTDLYPFYSFYPFACDYKVPFGIYYGDNAENIAKEAFKVAPQGNAFLLRDVVSRKKQLIPSLMKALTERMF